MRNLLVGAVVAVVFLAVAAIPLWPVLPETLGAHFGRQTPEAVFSSVFGRPVPAGVSELQAAGGDRTQVAWLRFRVGPMRVAELVGAAAPISAHAFESFAPRGYFQVPRGALGVADRGAVAMRWPDVYQARSPRYYSFYCPNGSPWFGVVAVDGSTGVAYVRAARMTAPE